MPWPFGGARHEERRRKSAERRNAYVERRKHEADLISGLADGYFAYVSPPRRQGALGLGQAFSLLDREFKFDRELVVRSTNGNESTIPARLDPPGRARLQRGHEIRVSDEILSEDREHIGFIGSIRRVEQNVAYRSVPV